MSFARVFPCSLAATLVVATISCGGDPPDKEIQQAQGAIDAARAAGADRYATEEFKAAQDALKRAHDAVSQRDYRLALNNALDSRERAQNAAKQAADGKAIARVAADRALSAATTALTAAQAALKGAEAPRAAGKSLNDKRLTIADAQRRLQEARAAFDRGEYAEVVEMASTVTSALTTATRDLEAARAPSPRRRR